MDKLKNLQKQLAEMRRLHQHHTPAGSKKYRELIAQVYQELKKLGPRLPTAKEWGEAAGTDTGTIMQV